MNDLKQSCRTRGVRPYLSAMKRPCVGLRGEFEQFWAAIARGVYGCCSRFCRSIVRARRELVQAWWWHVQGHHLKSDSSLPGV